MTDLRRAVDHFHVVLRWAALVDLHGAPQRSWIGDISYKDLVFGLTTRLPRCITDRLLHDFDGPSHNVWSRINTALRKAGRTHSRGGRRKPRRTNGLLEPMASLGATTSISEIVALPSRDVSDPFVGCEPRTMLVPR